MEISWLVNQDEETVYVENSSQSPNLESWGIPTPLKPRPLHLEGLEPKLLSVPPPSPPAKTSSWYFSEPHPPCCLEPMFSRAHPEPHQEAAFPLWEGVSHQEADLAEVQCFILEFDVSPN